MERIERFIKNCQNLYCCEIGEGIIKFNVNIKKPIDTNSVILSFDKNLAVNKLAITFVDEESGKELMYMSDGDQVKFDKPVNMELIADYYFSRKPREDLITTSSLDDFIADFVYEVVKGISPIYIEVANNISNIIKFGDGSRGEFKDLLIQKKKQKNDAITNKESYYDNAFYNSPETNSIVEAHRMMEEEVQLLKRKLYACVNQVTDLENKYKDAARCFRDSDQKMLELTAIVEDLKGQIDAIQELARLRVHEKFEILVAE